MGHTVCTDVTTRSRTALDSWMDTQHILRVWVTFAEFWDFFGRRNLCLRDVGRQPFRFILRITPKTSARQSGPLAGVRHVPLRFLLIMQCFDNMLYIVSYYNRLDALFSPYLHRQSPVTDDAKGTSFLQPGRGNSTVTSVVGVSWHK